MTFEAELPSVTVLKVCAKPRPSTHVIVFANEKGGVGKSTLAFHHAVALASRGHKVAVIDLDRRQQSLARALGNRENTARCLGKKLPCPRHAVLHQPNGPQLHQEIARIGSGCDFVIVDVPGTDSPLARYAIALADTLVTPINPSHFDLDVLGHFDPVRGTLREPGPFASCVRDINAERARVGRPLGSWIVVKNRVRKAERNQQARVDKALAQLATEMGFEIGEGLSERVVYRELLSFGLTCQDLKRIPELGRNKPAASKEIDLVVDCLSATGSEECEAVSPGQSRTSAPIANRVTTRFREQMEAHAHPL